MTCNVPELNVQYSLNGNHVSILFIVCVYSTWNRRHSITRTFNCYTKYFL